MYSAMKTQSKAILSTPHDQTVFKPSLISGKKKLITGCRSSKRVEKRKVKK